MKKKLLPIGLIAISVAALLSFTVLETNISGKIVPGDGANTVWAIAGTDTAKAGVSSGAFVLQVKPGTYKLIIDAKDPYKDVIMENIEVKQDQAVNLGEIVLQK